jgi:hypothetical protein
MSHFCSFALLYDFHVIVALKWSGRFSLSLGMVPCFSTVCEIFKSVSTLAEKSVHLAN